jgi:hypothetical protein
MTQELQHDENQVETKIILEEKTDIALETMLNEDSSVAKLITEQKLIIDELNNDDCQKPSRRKQLTIEDEAAALRLRNLWEDYKETHNINQTEFADKNLGGWSQGNFSQYLTGGVPIGQKALLRMCAAFRCEPGDIREELRDKSASSLKIKTKILSSENKTLEEENKRLKTALSSAMQVIESLSKESLTPELKSVISFANEIMGVAA